MSSLLRQAEGKCIVTVVVQEAPEQHVIRTALYCNRSQMKMNLQEVSSL